MRGLEKAREDARQYERRAHSPPAQGRGQPPPSDTAQRIHTELGNQEGFYKQMGYPSEKVVPSTLCKTNGNNKMKNFEFKGSFKNMD